MSRSISTLCSFLVAGAVVGCSVPPTTFAPEDGGDTPGQPRLVLTPSSLPVGEGATAMFTVSLSAEPAAGVRVTLASADDNRLGVMPASLELDLTAWAVAHAVMVTGKSDTDTEDELVAVAVAVDAGEIADGSVMVTIDDDDDLGIVATPASGLQVDEAMVAPLMVRLNAPPTGDVDVAVASSDASIAMVSPDTLHFTVDTWSLDQTVVVGGVVDLDTDHEDATVMLTATGLDPVPVAVQVVDRDVQAILTTTGNLGTRPEGTTLSFGVTLRFQPTSTISVAVGTSDSNVAAVSPASLSFDAGNWNTPHTVTVTLPEDLDTASETAEIELTSPPLLARQVGVSVTDDDVQRIDVSPTAIALVEGGLRGVDVSLAYQPQNDVTLAVTTLDGLVATASPAMVTFTPANYAQAQPVVVTAVPDLDPDNEVTGLRLASTTDPLSRDVVINVTDDDQQLIRTTTSSVSLGEIGSMTFGVHLNAMPTADVTVNLDSGDPTAAAVTPATLTFTSGTYGADQTVTVSGVNDLDLALETVTINLVANGMPPATVTAMVSDDDTQRVLVAPGAISVNEAGSGTINVSLEFTPAASTTVNLASLDPNVATVGSAMLTFTPANHATPRQVVINGVDDPDAIDETTTIVASATDATNGTASVTVNDNDPLGITTTLTTVPVTEGSQATFGVRLTAQPASTTTVTLSSSDGLAATVAGTMLTFTTGNWNVNQTVVVTGIADADPLDEEVIVTLRATGLTDRTVTVTVDDDDPQGIVASASTVPLTEAGSATFNVRLAAMPAADVTVSVDSADINAATVSPATLTFTPANYAVDRMITVSGVDDSDMANRSVAINLASSGLPPITVTATVSNTDVQAVLASPTGTISVNEGSSTGVGFRLAFRPVATTTVTLTPGAGVGVTPGTLSFAPASYAVVQSASVSGTQDDNAANVNTSVVASAPSSLSATVPMLVVDDDPLLLELSLPAVMIGEAGSATVGVRLTAQPLDSTIVNISSNDMDAATALPATRTFTTANWDTFQNITIAGVNDADVASEGVTVTVSSPPVPAQTSGVTVTDDDVVEIVPSASSLVIDEPSNGTFTVTLGHQPAAGLTVSVVSTDTNAALVSPATLTFTTGNWSTAQTVTVTGVADADADAESLTVNLTSPGAQVAGAVTVTVRDDELVLGDLSVQMGAAAGGTAVTAIGAGFTPATTLRFGAAALTNQMVPTATQLTGTTAAGARFVDAVAQKGAVTATIPRAYYHGTWQPATGGLWGGSVDAVLATGASTVFASSGGALYRSTDSGATWSLATSNPSITGSGLAVDPQNSQRVYATGDGVYVSTNGGATWAATGSLNQTVRGVAVAPSSSAVLYACTYSSVFRSINTGGTWSASLNVNSPVNIAVSAQDPNLAYVASGDGVHKTINGGVSWSLVTAGNTYWVAVDPTNASVAYAARTSGTVKTTNGGTTWSAVGPGLLGTPAAILVHPTTSQNVYAGSWDGVYRSQDGGASWMRLSTGMPSGKTDVRSLTMRPGSPNDLFVGVRDWGLFRSADGGSTWTESDTGIAGYSASLVVAHPTVTGTVFAGPQGMGLWRSVDHGVTWQSVHNGLPQTPAYHTPFSIAFTPGAPSIMFAGMPGSNDSVYKSTDGGGSWSPSASGMPQSLPVYGFAIAAASPSTILAATTSGVYRSLDAGETWAASSNGIGDPTLTSIAFLGGVYYAGSTGGIYRSTDVGATWTLASTGLPGTLFPQLVADSLSGALYLQSYSELFRTVDGGASWTLLSNSASGVAIDPARSATVYLSGYGTGMRRSLSSMQGSVGFGDGLPANSSGRVALDRTGGTVYLGVWGRGMWRLAP